MARTLRQQIDEISVRRVNDLWARSIPFATRVKELCSMAFVDRWTGVDAEAIRQAARLVDQGTLNEDVPEVLDYSDGTQK